jgi:hypothetical protein
MDVGRKSGTIFQSSKAESNISNLYLINVSKLMAGLKPPCLQILKKLKCNFSILDSFLSIQKFFQNVEVH